MSPIEPLRLHELQTGHSKTGLEPLAQERNGEIDTNQSQNKERNRAVETLSMKPSSRVESEANHQHNEKVKAALVLSTLWDNRQPD